MLEMLVPPPEVTMVLSSDDPGALRTREEEELARERDLVELVLDVMEGRERRRLAVDAILKVEREEEGGDPEVGGNSEEEEEGGLGEVEQELLRALKDLVASLDEFNVAAAAGRDSPAAAATLPPMLRALNLLLTDPPERARQLEGEQVGC